MMSSKEISPSLFTSTCFSSHLWPHFDLPPPLISHWQEFILMHDPPIFISFPLLTGFWASFSLDLPLVISPPNLKMGFPWWLSGKESACQCRRRWFNSWVRKIPWRRKWQPTPILLGNPMDRGAWWVTVHGIAEESDDLAIQQWQQQQIIRLL